MRGGSSGRARGAPCSLPADGTAVGNLWLWSAHSVLICTLVASCSALRDKVLAGSLEPECALVNAALVPDAIVLRAAAEKALMAKQRGTLRCKSAHAELVFNLSGSKHVRRLRDAGAGGVPVPSCRCRGTPPGRAGT